MSHRNLDFIVFGASSSESSSRNSSSVSSLRLLFLLCPALEGSTDFFGVAAFTVAGALAAGFFVGDVIGAVLGGAGLAALSAFYKEFED